MPATSLFINAMIATIVISLLLLSIGSLVYLMAFEGDDRQAKLTKFKRKLKRRKYRKYRRNSEPIRQ